MEKLYHCVECGSHKVYRVEFRTDYAKPRLVNPLNEGLREVDSEEMGYRLDGNYCMNCGSLVSVAQKEEVTDRKVELLVATKKLLEKQEQSRLVLNLLKETIYYDEANCDGSCLLEDIRIVLDEE